MTTVLMVDDKQMVRSAISRLLRKARRGLEVLEADSGERALGTLRRKSVDLVFLDVSMPNRGGMLVLRDIVRVHPNTPVVMLTVHGQAQLILSALQEGARGYVTKDSPVETLLDAIERVTNGGHYLCPTAQVLHLEASAPGGAKGIARLSLREREVFDLLCTGTSVKQIAAELGIARHTVSTHKKRVFEKMGWEGLHDMYAFLSANHLLGE